MKIVFLDAKTVGDVPNLSELESFGELQLFETTTPDETAARIKEADIVITNKVVLDRQLIEAADRLSLICVAATGMNNIDREAAADHGIPVKNVAGYASRSVAQGTFSMILHHLLDLRSLDHYVKSGDYSKSDIFTHIDPSFSELYGKRFGILGLGNIGSQVARIAEAFGSEVVYYSASGRNTDQPYLRLDLEEFLSTSDIVSIHAPLNEYTENLIDYKRLKLMKPSAILVNVGRGGIVNETDLARALNEGVLSAAGIDVFESEPVRPDNPLLKIDDPKKLVLTPHMTWTSVEARTMLVNCIAENIREFIEAGK